MIPELLYLAFFVSGIVILFSKKSKKFKAALVGLYIFTTAVVVNTYQSAIYADEMGGSGVEMNWFGDKWPLVLGCLGVAIVVLNILGLRKKKR